MSGEEMMRVSSTPVHGWLSDAEPTPRLRLREPGGQSRLTDDRPGGPGIHAISLGRDPPSGWPAERALVELDRGGRAVD
jgi:hypothetical protein